ncbi:MAG: hypothetical protein C4527_04545 [Candidatus Omnitrophota bacterium]|jgi:tetratricopeptide (TPR) repeat protein|nr:MAG: hypothetical protein C4527_04545 [Candidatus Omnitrophota bacterium]
MKNFWNKNRKEILIGLVLGILLSAGIEYFGGGLDGIARRIFHANKNNTVEYKETALHKAVRQGSASVVELLLSDDAEVHARDEQGFTPLHLAALHGHIPIIQMLLERGADINVRDSKHDMTPLYIAMVAQQSETVNFLKDHGADDTITDLFHQTPAQAAEVMKERAERTLMDASSSLLPFDPQAIVMILYLGITPDGNEQYKGIRIGFAVENGSMILTAAHCLTDFINDAEQGSLVKPIVISSFYGDAFEAEIIHMDHKADWAVLRAPWPSHPALPIASEEELAHTKEMIIAAFPPRDKVNNTIQISREVSGEKIRFHELDTKENYPILVLCGAKFVGPGWSGSPMISAANGNVLGVFTRHRVQELDDIVLIHNPMGPAIVHVPSLLREKELLAAPDEQNNAIAPPSQAEISLHTILDFIEALINGDPSKALHKVQDWVDTNEHSFMARLLLASTAEIMWAKNRSNEEYMTLTDSSYKKAISINPSHAMAHARYASFFLIAKQNTDALNELDAALALEPNLLYAHIKKLHAFIRLNPKKAVELGKELRKEHPQSQHGWLGLIGAYKESGEHELEIDAIRQYTQVMPDSPHRGLLADALARAGKLEEAESQYKANVENHECAWCWFAYAKFLCEYYPDRIEDARQALENAETFNTQHQLVNPDELKDFRKRFFSIQSESAK